MAPLMPSPRLPSPAPPLNSHSPTPSKTIRRSPLPTPMNKTARASAQQLHRCWHSTICRQQNERQDGSANAVTAACLRQNSHSRPIVHHRTANDNNAGRAMRTAPSLPITRQVIVQFGSVAPPSAPLIFQHRRLGSSKVAQVQRFAVSQWDSAIRGFNAEATSMERLLVTTAASQSHSLPTATPLPSAPLATTATAWIPVIHEFTSGIQTTIPGFNAAVTSMEKPQG